MVSRLFTLDYLGFVGTNVVVLGSVLFCSWCFVAFVSVSVSFEEHTHEIHLKHENTHYSLRQLSSSKK